MSKRKRTEDETESSQQDIDLGGNSVIEQRLQFETERLAKLNLLSEQQEQIESAEKEVEILTGVQRKKPSANSEAENNRKKNLEKNAEDLVAIQDEDARVSINVGGQTFVTSKQTLSNEETIFKIMMNTSLPIDRDENGAILVEEGRTPENFVIILDYLRSRKLNAIGLPLDDAQKLQELLDDSDFYGTAKLSNYLRQLIADKVETETLRLKRVEEQKQATKDEEEEVVEIEPVDEKEIKKRDEEWMQKFSEMTLQQTKKATKYFDEKKSQLDQKRQELESKKQEIFSKSQDKRFLVRLNVGGREYDADLAMLIKHKESIFVKTFEKLGDAEKSTLFIDRDPDLFNYIIEHLRTGKTSHIPFNDAAKSRQIREEAKYFNIPTLIEFFDPLRYPIETIGEENIKMKHNEDALRRLFAKDRSNPLLDDPYLHLLPVFEVRETFNQGDAPSSVPLMFNFEATANLGGSSQKNVPHPPVPRLTSTKQEFTNQFDAFTTGLFDGVDWSNIFAAGGGVLASAMKVENSAQKRTQSANFNATDDEADGEITGLSVSKLYGEDDDLEDIEEVDNMEEEEEEEEETFGEDVFTDSDDESKKQPTPFYGQPQNVTSTLKAFTSDPYRNMFSASKTKNLNALQKLVSHYEASIYNGSDIDLFLYGISEQEAEAKIVQLYNQFKLNLKKDHLKKYTTDQLFNGMYHYGAQQGDTNTDDIFVLRTKQAVTFHFTYPIRPVQIILRIYKSPAEVLMGFDLDCCTIGYDGNQVWALPRARRAIASRMNLVDVDRQSTTYEVRLFKYAKRGFRVGVPGYDASKIKNSSLLDSDLYDRLREAIDQKGIERKYRTNTGSYYTFQQRRNYKERHGLSRLILLERSVGQEFRDSLSNIGLTNSHAPNALGLAEQEVRGVDPREERERSYKAAKEEKKLDTNMGYRRYRRRSQYKPKNKTSDYAAIFIPFSRRWTPQNTFNRFQGTIQFIKESVNKNYSPEFMYQLNEIKSVLQGNAMDSDLAGPIEWMIVDPGTQMVGSFNPVDTNFYQDAYERSDEQREVLKLVMQQKNKEETDQKEKEKFKKRVQIVWSWDTGKSKYQPYDKDVIIKIEKQYRIYQAQTKSGAQWYMNPVDSVEITAMHKIDFKKMQQVQIKDSTRTRKVKREKIKVGKAWDRHEKRKAALAKGTPVFVVDDDEEEEEDDY